MNESSTGLPSLPDGYFWRVKHGRGSQYVVVQIRKRYIIGSSSDAWSATTVSSVGSRGAAEIRSTANYVMSKWNGPSNRRKDIQPFLGDYPPKMLP